MGLQAIWRLAALSYYRWALREMGPQHPDVPHVVLRVRELEDAHVRHGTRGQSARLAHLAS